MTAGVSGANIGAGLLVLFATPLVLGLLITAGGLAAGSHRRRRHGLERGSVDPSARS
jgi:hypothetical protein